MNSINSSILGLLHLWILIISTVHVDSATFTITNNCGYTVWPGLLSGAGTSPLPTTGFVLEPGESKSVEAPASWSGRLWGRTLCSTDSSTGKLTCATGDCGSGAIDCSGGGAAPPATLAEFTLDGSGGMDFYDVSLVDGYNLPMLVVADGTNGGICATTGCLVDLNGACPSGLKMTAAADGGAATAVACQSACRAFNTPEYCCSGEYGNPDTCRPTAYSEYFKNACPRAYSYAYDDATSTFTCAAGANYAITFCPSKTSLKSSDVNTVAGGLPLVNDSMSISDATAGAAALPAPLIIPLAAVTAASLLLLGRQL